MSESALSIRTDRDAVPTAPRRHCAGWLLIARRLVAPRPPSTMTVLRRLDPHLADDIGIAPADLTRH